MNKFEWVITMSKGDDIVLTEKQYEYYLENITQNNVSFDDYQINPAFVVSAYKRPAQVIKEKYPCKNCGTAGIMNDYSQCPVCGGSGVNI
jgi:rubrerythrin